MYKKGKCFGRKKVTLLETSVTQAFFEKFKSRTNCLKKNIKSFEDKSCSSSESIENSNIPNLKFPRFFSSFYETTKKEESPAWKKKVSAKSKLQMKFKLKYKGKRKFQNNIISKEEPNWSSILKHNLVIENCCEKVRVLHFNDVKNKNNSKLVPGTDNRKTVIPKKKKKTNSSTIYESLNSLTALNISLPQNAVEEKEIINSSTNKNSKSIADAVFLTQIERKKETKNQRSNSITYSQKLIPLTSTPLIPSKRISEKGINFLNLSDIPASQKKKKKELFLESSFVMEVSLSKNNQNRNLKLSGKSSFQQSSRCLHKELCTKSYSNKDRSFFLRSDNNPKEVLIKGSDDSTILYKLLQLCNQTKIMAFMKVYDWKKFMFRKVGEGSYGEVFMCTKSKKSMIIKVIPVSQDDGNNLQSIENVYSEIKVSQCLNQLRYSEDYQTKNFNFLKKACVVQGAYPLNLLRAWDLYSNTKTTFNSRPDVFDDQQIFVILELEYGGKDMTSFVLRNAVEAESVLKQITLSLAVAEEKHFFEHRDLHLGNILVQRNKSKKISYKFRGKSISIASEGLLVTIIDFTLSRILEDGYVYYNDLADDESLFNQMGDFQFDVYRATKFQLKNQWHECLLYSNVLWLNFLCLKFEKLEYSRPSTAKHRSSLQNIKAFAEKLKSCESALDCVIKCSIVCSLPEKSQSFKPKKEICFIDRKSFQQKSNLGN